MIPTDRNAALVAAALRGRFITFEGGDGVGKSTQVRRLQARLDALDVPVLVTREPGGTERAERIREVLLGGRARRHGTLAEAALFAAARLDHVRYLIRPAQMRGEIVICDRFIDSSRVYQGAVGALEPNRLAHLEAAATDAVMPDLTLVLDLSAAAAKARSDRRRASACEPADRFEDEGRGYHEAVASAFRAAALAEPGRCALIDAGQDPDRVADSVWAAICRSVRHDSTGG